MREKRRYRLAQGHVFKKARIAFIIFVLQIRGDSVLGLVLKLVL